MGTYNAAWNDGAWDIPGFTAQNPLYPPSQPLNGTPIVPYATITGTFLAPSGQVANGMVTMTPSVRQYIYNGVRYEIDPIKIQIMQGLVNFTIPAPTAATNPATWTWDIRVRVGPYTSDYPTQLVASGTTLDLGTLTP